MYVINQYHTHCVMPLLRHVCAADQYGTLCFVQYKFGARWGAAPVILGVFKLALGLLFGSSLFQLLKLFPEPLLGAMLVMSGVELASAARKENSSRGYAFLMLTAAAILALEDTSYGFCFGYVCYLVVVAYEWVMPYARKGRMKVLQGVSCLKVRGSRQLKGDNATGGGSRQV